MIKDNMRTLILKLPSESNRVQFYSVIFLILVVFLGTFSLETSAMGSQAVFAKKHIATANSPSSQASPVTGDTCQAGYAQGFHDAKSGPLDQSIFDKHGTIYTDCYQQGYMKECLATPGNTVDACKAAQDAG